MFYDHESSTFICSFINIYYYYYYYYRDNDMDYSSCWQRLWNDHSNYRDVIDVAHLSNESKYIISFVHES